MATECGWGRGGAAAVDGLLALHREVAAPLNGADDGTPAPSGRPASSRSPTTRGRPPRPTPAGVTYDHVDGHGWYANLDPTVEDLAAGLADGDMLLDYSGGTGILLERLRPRIAGRRVGALIVDPSPTFLRVALEKFRGDELVGLRLLDGSLDEAMGPELAAPRR